MEFKRYRLKKGLTMNQVAKASGISESMYCLIENGKRTPSLRVIRRIASALGCKLDDLVEDVEGREKI